MTNDDRDGIEDNVISFPTRDEQPQDTLSRAEAMGGIQVVDFSAVDTGPDTPGAA